MEYFSTDNERKDSTSIMQSIREIDNRSNADPTAFVDIPDEALLLISSLSSPRDVYSLCLTARRFHSTTGIPSIASRMLRVSLRTSLDRVLQSSKIRITLAQLDELFAEVRPGSVMIAGSTMAQCVLGVVWKDSDLDIYCAMDAAPTVRSWLVKTAGQCFIGFNDHYVGSENIGRALQTTIHHVEYYAHAPADGSRLRFHLSGNRFAWEKACQYGASINENGNGYPRPCHRILGLGTDQINQQYRIETRYGDPFPFDLRMNGDKSAVDLVVSARWILNPRNILDDFDLSICKSSYDGLKFLTPEPHKTFNGHSTIERERRALMMAYRQNYVQIENDEAWSDDDPMPEPVDEVERFRRIQTALELVQRSGSGGPTLNRMQWVIGEIDHEIAGDDDDMFVDIMQRQSELIAMHNFIFKLFDRLKKYQNRGIFVEDAPDTTGFNIRGFDALDLFDCGGVLMGHMNSMLAWRVEDREAVRRE